MKIVFCRKILQRKRRWCAAHAEYSDRLRGRADMLAIELHPFYAAVFVYLQPIGEPQARAAAQPRILGGTANVAEGDGLDRITGALGNLELHFQVFAADDPGVLDLEVAVEDGLRKTLPPWARAAQHTGGVEGELGGRKHAVGVNHPGERFVVAA